MSILDAAPDRGVRRAQKSAPPGLEPLLTSDALDDPEQLLNHSAFFFFLICKIRTKVVSIQVVDV